MPGRKAGSGQTAHLDQLVQVRADRSSPIDALAQPTAPAWCVPRRSYDVEVIGAGLLAAADGQGYRKIAAGLQVPASTVRGWLAAVRAGSAALIAPMTPFVEAFRSPPLNAIAGTCTRACGWLVPPKFCPGCVGGR